MEFLRVPVDAQQRLNRVLRLELIDWLEKRHRDSMSRRSTDHTPEFPRVRSRVLCSVSRSTPLPLNPQTARRRISPDDPSEIVESVARFLYTVNLAADTVSLCRFNPAAPSRTEPSHRLPMESMASEPTSPDQKVIDESRRATLLVVPPG